MSLGPNGNLEMWGSLGPDYLHADIQVNANGSLYVIDGELADMPFHQTIQRLD